MVGEIIMKQFNLDEYLKNPNRRIVTGKGKPARIICTNRKSENCPIIALIQDSTDNYEDAHYYTIDGKWVVGGNNSMDLFFAPEKKEGWINIYSSDYDGTSVLGENIFETKEEAEASAKNCVYYITTIKIEWEE